MKLSIVIPCYNESENIENSFQTLKKITAKITPNYEMIFVDDGGTDNQWELMKKINGCWKGQVKTGEAVYGRLTSFPLSIPNIIKKYIKKIKKKCPVLGG